MIPAPCRSCRDGAPLGIEFTMAFQPIVDVQRGRIWGYEALVRGAQGQGAGFVLDQVTGENRYKFDQACRVKAIELAGRLFTGDEDTRLSINFMPNAVYEPAACIRATLDAARRVGFERHRLMFEFTEGEPVDVGHVQKIIMEYRRQGFITAIDDFGAGFAGLGLLADFQPDLIKIDMKLVRGIAENPARQAIVAGVVAIARQLGITVLAEGIETESEMVVLRAAGISLLQGYYFAKPITEALPPVAGIGDLSLTDSARSA
ncbi:MAG TPA: EAL domain-containing protein [Enterovirga sp.]|nr:EAL domain-containing protein [Enterovirga sp.]